MGRSPSCDENGLKKGPWTPEEDGKLVSYIEKHGHGSWRALPKLAGLNRCGKSCRLRWTNYLRPDIKRGKFTEEESQIIINWHSILGNKWSAIASHLPGRTDNEIKNFWNTHLRKKLLQMGIDPVTHRPRTDLNFLANLPQLLAAAANISNFTNPWDNALITKLQTDATQVAKIQFLHNILQVLNMNVTTPANLETLNYFGSSSISGTQLYHELPRVNSSKHEASGLQKSSITACPIINHSTETDIPNFQTVFPQSATKPSTDDQYIDEKDENLINAYPISLPTLVSASTERLPVKGIENKIASTDLSNPSSTSTTLDRWEDFMDDEASDSYWKDLIDQQTSQW